MKKKNMHLDHFLLYLRNSPYYINKSSIFSIINRFAKLKPIVRLCKFFNVSTSGYYKWLKRLNRVDLNKSIVEEIITLQKKHQFNLGYRRMKIELDRIGTNISEGKAYRLMRKHGLLSNALYTKKARIITKSIHSYSNQLKGDFSAIMPNLKWCTDITMIKTEEAPIYLCALIDLYDRSIVSYKIYNVQNTKLVKSTIEAALKKENIQHNIPVLLHSDHGSQFSNNNYNRFLKANNINPSMSAKGCPNKNAVIESFFATLKLECVYRYIFKTVKEAKSTIKDFMEYYNFARISLRTKKTPMEIRYSGF